MEETITEIDIDELIKDINSRSLILFNDEVNNFDYVTACLVKYCKHSIFQAEQCTQIAHYKGKYGVKSGSFDELQPIHQALSENNLTVEIQ